MPSEFALNTVREVRGQEAFEADGLGASLAILRVDLSTIKIRSALSHAIYRNHEHSPKSCSACEGIEKAAEWLKVK